MRRNYIIIGLIVLTLGAIVLNSGLQMRVIESMGEWDVTYYTMIGINEWGDAIGTDTFPSEFDYDPLPVSREREEAIGFRSSMDLDLLKGGDIEFTIVADDGVIVLVVDGETLEILIAPDPDDEVTSQVFLEAGSHNIQLRYFQIVPVLEDDPHAAFQITIQAEEQARLATEGGIAPIYAGVAVAFLGLRLDQTPPKETDNAEDSERKYKQYFVYFLVVLIAYSLTVYIL